MGMSTKVVGFRPANAKWEQMKTIWETCASAGVEIPDEVDDFFNGENPHDMPGMEVELKEASSEYNADMQEGYEVDITKLPKGVTILRFTNSW